MALRNILKEDDPTLRKRSREVPEINERILILLDDMKETMTEGAGVGLAAPQVGVLRRIFIASLGHDQEERELKEFIDPEIIEAEGEQEGDEGCLSVPGYVGTVKRPERIRIKYKDRQGDEKVEDFTDFDAVIVCHEFDHLEGVLYTDKAEDIREAVAGAQDEGETDI